MKLLSVSFLIILFFGCSSKSSLKVATSSNMKSAMVDVVTLFQETHHVDIDIIEGSSGKLTAQIENGAPYDIFVSADTIYPNYLFEKGFSEALPEVYAHGKLVLWTAKGFIPSLERLTSSKISKIAIANHKTAPYGLISDDILTNYGIYDSVYDKLVFSESVSQCDTYIYSKSVDVGITSMSTVKSDKMKNVGNWVEIDSNLYDFLPQAALHIYEKLPHPEAKLFYDFLFSEEVKVILRTYGYQVH